eukprot:jgi/Hompol1/917/HPOL_001051-RA
MALGSSNASPHRTIEPMPSDSSLSSSTTLTGFQSFPMQVLRAISPRRLSHPGPTVHTGGASMIPEDYRSHNDSDNITCLPAAAPHNRVSFSDSPIHAQSAQSQMLPNDITILVQDYDTKDATQSMPVGGLRKNHSKGKRSSLANLFGSPTRTSASDSDDDSVSSSSASTSNKRRTRKAVKKRGSTKYLGVLDEGNGSSSNLSLAGIASTIQHFKESRHGSRDFTSHKYTDIFGDREDYELKRDFMLELTRAMAEYGLPSHRLEYHLEAIGECLGIKSSYAVHPGLILMSFMTKKRSSETFFIKQYQGYSMGKLSALNDLCFEVVHGAITVEEAGKRLADIRASKNSPAWTALITFPLIAFSICACGFSGTWGDSLIAAIVSIPVAGLSLATEYVPSITYLVEFLSALVSTVLGKALRLGLETSFPCLATDKIVFSAIAILLPGLSLTTSIIEISTRNMVSGTVRMFHAIFTAVLLGFGFAVGDNLTSRFPLDVPDPKVCSSQPISLFWSFIMFPILGISISYQFFARRQQYPIMLLAQITGFSITIFLPRIDALKNNLEATTIIAAFAIGLISNLYSRITRDVAIAPIIGGILLLVPGSVGVRSTLGFISQDALGGTAVAFQMLMIGLSITIGLFLATLI